jgi:hypothetical protein
MPDAATTATTAVLTTAAITAAGAGTAGAEDHRSGEGAHQRDRSQRDAAALDRHVERGREGHARQLAHRGRAVEQRNHVQHRYTRRRDAGVSDPDTTGLECYKMLAHAQDSKTAKYRLGTAVDRYMNFGFQAPWQGNVYGLVIKPVIDNAQSFHHWIGRDSVIGSNTWITQSVPPGTRVTYSTHGSGESRQRLDTRCPLRPRR